MGNPAPAVFGIFAPGPEGPSSGIELQERRQGLGFVELSSSSTGHREPPPQLLALSSNLTRDVYQRTIVPAAGLKSQVLVGRLLVAALAVLGLALAYQPPATILEIATQAFTGLSVLFPTTVATLYWSSTRPMACLLSILVGEALLIGFATDLIPQNLTFGFLPVIPILVVSSAIVVLGSLIGKGTLSK